MIPFDECIALGNLCVSVDWAIEDKNNKACQKYFADIFHCFKSTNIPAGA